MDWNGSEGSDEGEGHDSQNASRKRSSRACDQCRKTKSKCERGPNDGVPCKSCSLTGTACTFLGPSYKRGPPKGYIHAIEQRWHQVESLLGVILQCPDPRVRSVVADLRQDELARDILMRVDMGPYGPSGRRFQAHNSTKEDFFASVLRSNGSVPGRDQSRTRRQSRVSREKVSSNLDRGLDVVPTQEWQDNLANRLASASSASSPVYPSSCSTPSQSGQPAPQRRRLEASPVDWNEMYTIEATSDSDEHDSLKDPTEGIGELSLTENQEIRFHGKASGLHLLSKDNRTDDRNEGGIWRAPEPLPVKFSSPKPESSQQADTLLLLTMFAITARFVDNHEPKPSNGKMWEAGVEYLEGARTILSTWADAVSLDETNEFTAKIFDRSRPSTVQSLLLLGYREFGVGSMAIRMAIDLGLNSNSDRWKQHGHDLFARDETQTRRQIWWICCLADRYGSVYMGRPIIIREEDYDTPLPEVTEYDDELWQPLRADSFEVSYPAVPGKIMLTFNATSTLFTIIGDIITHIYPVRSSHKSPRRSLYAELETRLDQWYLRLPEALQFDVNSKRRVPPPHVLFVHIRYWGAVLLLNRAFIPNWRSATSANSPSADFSSTSRKSTSELKAFDLAQGAASRVSATVNAWRETFTLKRASPFLTAYMLSTGIMHILTLTLRPSNPQASLGLRQCMTALNEMSVLWPSAERALDLLTGVKISYDYESTHPPIHLGERVKRGAEDAFGQEKSSDYLQREAFGVPAGADGNHKIGQQPTPTNVQGVQDLSTRIMAHMLGLDIPGMEPSTSYYPGYEWWPRPGEQRQQLSSPLGAQPSQSRPMVPQAPPPQQHSQHPQHQQLPPFAQVAGDLSGYPRPSNIHGYPGPMAAQRMVGGDEWIPSTSQAAPVPVPDYSSYNYQYPGL
ncbi:hypothetical protein V5O48_005269 [Marasmius crinis-equi]|uniref:Zn(2)-C6 fungal-type domain-containing protein n=1 Tax=Marasmius crinis-equi TaxID=585013 RepID=A0ABR3FMS6_9AGAR